MTGSWRTKPLPKGWDKTRRRILRRDPTCRLRYDVCTVRSTEVDHISGPHDDSDANLQGVCTECHRVKSVREAHEARPKRRREPAKHPGIL